MRMGSENGKSLILMCDPDQDNGKKNYCIAVGPGQNMGNMGKMTASVGPKTWNKLKKSDLAFFCQVILNHGYAMRTAPELTFHFPRHTNGRISSLDSFHGRSSMTQFKYRQQWRNGEHLGHPAKSGRMITCSCTTVHCREEGTRTCSTTGLCFSQYLDRRDGTDPLVRGCISGRTHLLCENRRPAVDQHRSWPALMCCDKNMCNAKVFPTIPTTTTSKYEFGTNTSEVPLENDSPKRPVNSIYLVMVAIGVSCFGVVTVIVVYLLRRHYTFCDPEFGNVSPNGYVKGCPEHSHGSKGLENKVILHT
ncbi:uncharacterized protein TNCV_1261601 [Trichonephila clavipes]|nr:uncharacterized protein TNCV_1261601 [Trichonephila clavipes]